MSLFDQFQIFRKFWWIYLMFQLPRRRHQKHTYIYTQILLLLAHPWIRKYIESRYVYENCNEMCCVLQYKAKGGGFWNVELSNCQPTYCASGAEQKHIVCAMRTFLKDAGEESITNQYSFKKCFPSTLFLKQTNKIDQILLLVVQVLYVYIVYT